MAPHVPASRRATRAGRLLAVLIVLGALLAGCGVGRSSEPSSDTPSGDDQIDDLAEAREEIFLDITFERIDQRLDDRVAELGLAGAGLVVEPVEGEGHLHLVGTVGLDTPVALAESSMWTTAAVLLTLVDEGRLALDEPIGPHLPWLTGPSATITLRQLLSHTSGLPPSVDCAEPTPDACDAAIGRAPLVAPPGEGFAVTDLDAHVAARLAEAVAGETWAQLFADADRRPDRHDGDELRRAAGDEWAGRGRRHDHPGGPGALPRHDPRRWSGR